MELRSDDNAYCKSRRCTCASSGVPVSRLPKTVDMDWYARICNRMFSRALELLLINHNTMKANMTDSAISELREMTRSPSGSSIPPINRANGVEKITHSA